MCPFAAIYWHLLLAAAICWYLLLFAAICYYLLLVAIVSSCCYLIVFENLCYYFLLFSVMPLSFMINNGQEWAKLDLLAESFIHYIISQSV